MSQREEPEIEIASDDSYSISSSDTPYGSNRPSSSSRPSSLHPRSSVLVSPHERLQTPPPGEENPRRFSDRPDVEVIPTAPLLTNSVNTSFPSLPPPTIDLDRVPRPPPPAEAAPSFDSSNRGSNTPLVNGNQTPNQTPNRNANQTGNQDADQGIQNRATAGRRRIQFSRMGAATLRFFGLDEGNDYNVPTTVFRTHDDPEPPSFQEAAMEVTNSFARTIRRTISTNRVNRSDPPPIEEELDMDPAPPIDVHEVDHEFYGEPPTYDSLDPTPRPPRPLPPSMQYRQHLGTDDLPSPPRPSSQQQRPQRRPPGRGARPHRNSQNVSASTEEMVPAPNRLERGMTFLQDPKVRSQLKQQKAHPAYFISIVSIVQVAMFIYTLYYNYELYGTWIQTDPFNVMIGPGTIPLIELGGMYGPCMANTSVFLHSSQCPDVSSPALLSIDNKTTFCGNISSFCGMGGFPTGHPDQGYRLITALFLHSGVIHILFFLAVQIRVGFDIEKSFGSFRTLMIYFSSGFFGYVLAAFFNQQTPSVGCDGATYGLVSVLIVDLIQNWRLVVHPARQLAWLLFLVLIALAIGIVPFVDNYSHIGGLFMGIISGIVFIPTIKFGESDALRKRIVFVIALAIYLALMIGPAVGFFQGADASSCTWCTLIDCIPIIPGWCELSA